MLNCCDEYFFHEMSICAFIDLESTTMIMKGSTAKSLYNDYVIL